MHRFLVLVLALAACDGSASTASDDASIPGDDAGSGSGEVDHVAPHLLTISPEPGSSAWLHEPIRYTFDEPIVAPALTVTATLGGEPVEAVSTVDPDHHAVVITIAPGVRGVGQLEIVVEGEVVDRAGNPTTDELAVSYAIEPWSAPVLDRGAASGAAALAVTRSGDLVAAWLVGASGSRRVVVGRTSGEQLGAPLGNADVGSLALALDGDDRPVLAYIDGGQVIVLGWEGNAWIPLLAPGAASHVALASGAAPVLAVANGTSVTVRALTTGAWQPIGDELSSGPVSDLAVAPGAVGWIDAGGARVFRFTGSWTALVPVPGAVHLSLATRDQTLAIAWDQLSGSYGVYAAVAAGMAWTRLGGVLDVDAAGDARVPAIAIDADGAPVIVWQEAIEGVQRGVTASWNGSAWTILGGRSWLGSASVSGRPRLALGAGHAPAIAFTADGAVRLVRFNGPREAALGRDARASRAGCAFAAASPPGTVLGSGCFTLAAPGKVAAHAGLVPYDVISELWTDGVKKRRWIALPDGAGMTVLPTGAWEAPVGTVIIKEFALETTPGAPATRRAVETRFLVREAGGWAGFSYRWRADGSDADLLTDGQVTASWAIDGGGSYTHYYPSRSQCQSCHEGSFGPLLGLRPEQLQRWYDYDGVIADQLPTLVHLGVGPSSTAAPLPSPHDASVSVERRTRGYMAANCAHCHNPNHIAIKDLRITTPLAQTRLCEVIVPGAPANSRVYQLVTQRPGMPALGSLVPDPLIGSLISTWIGGMTSCP